MFSHFISIAFYQIYNFFFNNTNFSKMQCESFKKVFTVTFKYGMNNILT